MEQKVRLVFHTRKLVRRGAEVRLRCVADIGM